MTPDVIDRLAGIAPGSPLDALRAQRPEARANAEHSFQALFHPETPGEVTATERHAVAAFVAALHRDPAAEAFYATELARLDPALATTVANEAAIAVAQGPYGRYPAGPLAGESRDGPVYRASAEAARVLGQRLAAAFEHAHLLVFRPREASPAALQALLDSGWSTTGIVTLSQLVAFLTFQVRVVAGLRALNEGAAA